MFEIRSGINILILIYIISFFALWHYKPQIMFNGNKIKPFGIGPNKTIFNFHIVTIVGAILLFYIFEIIWQKKNNFL